MPPAVAPRSRSRLALLLALAALAPAGCGLADYEKKMQDAETRLQAFDDEDKVLGDPPAIPPDAKLPMDLFFRAPKGIAKDASTQPGDVPYHYPATGGVAADLYLLFGTADDGKDGLEKQVEGRFGPAASGWQPRQVQPSGRAALSFDSAEIPDTKAPNTAPAVYLACVHPSDAGGAHVALVFHVLQANRPAADGAITRSLESLREGGEVGKARSEWSRWRGH